MEDELKQMEVEDATDMVIRRRIEEFYKAHPEKTLKTLVFKAYYMDSEEFIAVVIRGDRKVNLEKLKKYLNLTKIRFAQKDEMDKLGLVMGYISPIDCTMMKIIADSSIRENSNYYDGGNKPFLYRKNVNYPRDFSVYQMLKIGE